MSVTIFCNKDSSIYYIMLVLEAEEEEKNKKDLILSTTTSNRFQQLLIGDEYITKPKQVKEIMPRMKRIDPTSQ